MGVAPSLHGISPLKGPSSRHASFTGAGGQLLGTFGAAAGQLPGSFGAAAGQLPASFGAGLMQVEAPQLEVNIDAQWLLDQAIGQGLQRRGSAVQSLDKGAQWHLGMAQGQGQAQGQYSGGEVQAQGERQQGEDSEGCAGKARKGNRQVGSHTEAADPDGNTSATGWGSAQKGSAGPIPNPLRPQLQAVRQEGAEGPEAGPKQELVPSRAAPVMASPQAALASPPAGKLALQDVEDQRPGGRGGETRFKPQHSTGGAKDQAEASALAKASRRAAHRPRTASTQLHPQEGHGGGRNPRHSGDPRQPSNPWQPSNPRPRTLHSSHRRWV